MLSNNEGGTTKLVIPPHLLISKPSIVIEDVVEPSEETNNNHGQSFSKQPLHSQRSTAQLLSKHPSTISVTQIKDS